MTLVAHHRAASAHPPRVELADVFARHADAYLSTHYATPIQRKVVRAIIACRTPALGGHRPSSFGTPEESSIRTAAHIEEAGRNGCALDTRTQEVRAGSRNMLVFLGLPLAQDMQYHLTPPWVLGRDGGCYAYQTSSFRAVCVEWRLCSGRLRDDDRDSRRRL